MSTATGFISVVKVIVIVVTDVVVVLVVVVGDVVVAVITISIVFIVDAGVIVRSIVRQ